ncbi:uncharacterized protein C12orf50 homolog [Onychostruthus taczanowskii]|uniref:uncharacterized protein C12orf50 homolog n=1 Tax=Onychostruthus taczanowskii TaxID=356909 RepID=UPI001B8096BD|nr:uncharacterized protein C12orf50 homolog [Onychostruthus taczanowskii]
MACTAGCRRHLCPGVWSSFSRFFPDLGGQGFFFSRIFSLLPLTVVAQQAVQNYSKFSCFWETEPVGCRRISCDFFHRKPRNINGLYLPPSNNVPLKQDVQGGILHQAHRQDSLRNQDNVLVPIHPPLIINLSDEEDDEEDDEDDDEEDNCVSNWMSKTVIDIEEERAIRDICYKSGEYYGIQNPYKHQSTKTVSSLWQDELLPLEVTEQNLQKGDGNTIPTRFNNTRKEKENSERRVSVESIPRTDHKSFDNGETSYTELVKNHQFKEVKENKRISEERRNSANAVTGKGIHTPDPKGKPGYQQRGQSKEDETASSSPYGRDTGRYTHLNSPEPRRSAYVVYRTVTQKPKFSGPTAVPESYGQKGSKQKNQPDTNRRFWTQTENYGKYTSGSSNSPAWRKRNPQAKPFSKFKITIQSKEDMEVNKKGEKETSKGK